MIKVEEYITDDERVLKRTYSDRGVKIKHLETGRLYSDAIELPESESTFEETDVPVPDD